MSRFDVGRHLRRRGAVKDYYDLLVQHHRMKGDPDAERSARIEVERVLDDAFDGFAKHYSGRKKAALDRLLKLQKDALDIYERAVAGFEVDAAQLERIYTDMDRNFRELGRRADDLAAEAAPRPQKQSHRVPDPEGRRKAEGAKTALEEEAKAAHTSITQLGEELGDVATKIKTILANAPPAPPATKQELDDLTRQARRKKPPISDQDPNKDLKKQEYDVEARLEALAALEARPGHSKAAADYLAWQRDLFNARAEQLGIKGTVGAVGERASTIHQVQLPAAEKAFRAASQAIKELLRKKGPNFTERSKVTYDEILEEGPWKELASTLKPDQRRLNTDHLVSVDEIGNMPELGDFLRLYEEAPDALKGEMTRALIDLGDRPGNLVRMRADANQSAMKSNRSWEEITPDQAKEFGYEWAHIEKMRDREAGSRAAIKKRILEMTDDYRRRIHGR
jgi:hypothetical protein